MLEECDRFFGTSSNSNSDGSFGGRSLGGGAEESINGEARVSFGACGGEARLVEALTAVIFLCSTTFMPNPLTPPPLTFPRVSSPS